MANKLENYKIKPASRIIYSIGEDLVGDPYAALVELVKNSFDADASKSEITLEFITNNESPILKIEITDDGHGMDRQTVLQKWLVPATSDKLERIKSPNGRLLQGKKGIGRFSSAVLGQEMVLNTVDKKGIQTEVLIYWDIFSEKEFLEDVDIAVVSNETSKPSGTTLSITAKREKVTYWTDEQLKKLVSELRKLKSPIHTSEDDFKIILNIFPPPFGGSETRFEIDELPVIELFDYKISGMISEEGKMSAIYENKSENNLPSERIEIQLKLKSGQKFCGPVEFDFRVFDRDPDSIENLISKGLIDPVTKLAMSKREAKKQLDNVYGVNLYREGIRIRPYGTGGIDWLDLDKARVQSFSDRVSNNQIVGFVNIKPEIVSRLEEKSARDGLKENAEFMGLITLLLQSLNELEIRRRRFRISTGRGKTKRNIQKDLDTLFDFDTLNQDIKTRLTTLKADEKTIGEISQIISKEALKKSILLEEIQNTIAIYQGQATLGKIVTVLLHEGRKPISFLKQQSVNLFKWLKFYKAQANWNDTLYDEIQTGLAEMEEQSDFMASLFKRIEPLSRQSRGGKKEFDIAKTIEKSGKIFSGVIKDNQIHFKSTPLVGISFLGWEEDLMIILTNLIENSIYWLNQSNQSFKQISVETIESHHEIVIHFKDNGPGILEEDIRSEIIFEPGISKKLDGTGLGLAIAGEAAERLGGKLAAHYQVGGAYFTIEIKKK